MKLKSPPYKYSFLFLDITILIASFLYGIGQAFEEFFEILKTNYYFCFNHFILLCIFLIIFIFTFRYFSLYKRQIITARRLTFLQLIKALITGSATCTLILVILNVDYLADDGKQLLLNFLLLNGILFLVIRGFLGKNIFWLLVKNKILTRRLLIVGGDEAGVHVAKKLINDPFSDLVIAGFLDDYKEKGKEIFNGYSNLGKLEDLNRIVNERQVDEIIVAIDNAPYGRLIHIVETALSTGRLTRIYSEFLTVVAEKLDVELYNGVPMVDLPEKPLTGNPWKDKRTLDIILGSAALIALSPLFLVISLCIKLSSKGPIIYQQTRIGRDGKPFQFYKFRSMHVGNDHVRHKDYVTKYIKGEIDDGDKKINVFKITDDPRIFKFGHFIRKTSLDEFPQLFNVVKGDMTIVGPRPCLPYEWDVYDEWHKKRLVSLPGCTGLWQALGRSSVSFEEMVVLDLYYISNMSLWLDFKIVLKTFPVIFFGKGGH